MALVKWDPFQDMLSIEEIVDRLRSVSTVMMRDAVCGEWPCMDIAESEEAFIIRAEIPGVDKDDIEVLIDERNRLTIKGSIRDACEDNVASFFHIERKYGFFERTLDLPQPVDYDLAVGYFENGLLRIYLPKRPPQTIVISIIEEE